MIGDDVKVTGLTGSNVSALKQLDHELHGTVHPSGVLEVTATTATFAGPTADAAQRLRVAMEQLAKVHGRRGHPIHSLQAVARKLERKATLENVKWAEAEAD